MPPPTPIPGARGVGGHPPMQKSVFIIQTELGLQVTTGDLASVYPGRHLYLSAVPTA